MLALLAIWGCSTTTPHVEIPVTPRTWAPIDGPGNVLVLLIDDIGVDKVGSYGSPYAAHTPHMDQLAADGLRFDNAYASPMCSPARALLLTGRMSRRTGIGTITERESNGTELAEEAILIPEVLAQTPTAPWANGAIGKWHLSGGEVADWPTHPTRAGFDYFAGGRGNPQYKPERGYSRWSRNVNGTVADSTTYLTTGTADDALQRIAQMPEPWFLYVAFNSAHVPIHNPPAALRPAAVPDPGPDRVGRHDAMVAVLDREIGRMLQDMDPAVLGRTTVVTLGDNGTSRFGLRKNDGPPRNRVKHSVYEGGVRIPLIVNGPHVASPGTTTDAMVHLVDLLPTFADLAGLPMQGNSLPLAEGPLRLDGQSFLPVVRGTSSTGQTMIYTERFDPNGPGPYTKDLRGLRNATHKLIVKNGEERFYRLNDGWWEDEDNLLAPGYARTAEDDAQLAALRAEMQRRIDDLVYEGR